MVERRETVCEVLDTEATACQEGGGSKVDVGEVGKELTQECAIKVKRLRVKAEPQAPSHNILKHLRSSGLPVDESILNHTWGGSKRRKLPVIMRNLNEEADDVSVSVDGPQPEPSSEMEVKRISISITSPTNAARLSATFLHKPYFSTFFPENDPPPLLPYNCLLISGPPDLQQHLLTWIDLTFKTQPTPVYLSQPKMHTLVEMLLMGTSMKSNPWMALVQRKNENHREVVLNVQDICQICTYLFQTNPTLPGIFNNHSPLSHHLLQSHSLTCFTINQSSSSSSESLQLTKSFGKIEKFTGDCRDLTKNFVISICLHLTSLPNVSIAQKITFVSSHLNKTALDWFSNTVLIPDCKFATFEDFISLFSATFSMDEVIMEESTCKCALKQTGSCSAYTTKFLCLISYTCHNDYMQVDMFKSGLKPHILAHLSHSKQIMDLTKLILESYFMMTTSLPSGSSL
ncbi:hypothetical protein HDU98_008730 [Podochytrium sp. JEL0797]|nr:hypothetical protein HDU98_008730 [Podochytrium sp. JEL0797]